MSQKVEFLTLVEVLEIYMNQLYLYGGSEGTRNQGLRLNWRPDGHIHPEPLPGVMTPIIFGNRKPPSP